MAGDDVDLLRERLGRQRWHEPMGWWGTPWTPFNPRSMDDLVAAGVISRGDAGSLQGWVGAGGSLVVIAAESGSGKTTLLTALLESLPAGRERYYPRGFHDDFGAVASVAPSSLSLLVNEISPHLDHYCWGHAAQRLIDLGRRGAQILATSHGDSLEEWAFEIGCAIGVDHADLRCFGQVVELERVSSGNEASFHVRRIRALVG